MRMEGLRVLVTGGAGFIGSHVVDHLMERGCSVTVLDDFSTGKRENLAHHGGKVSVIEADVRSLESLVKASCGVDVVFHLAVRCVRLSLTDPITNHEVNATGTLNALVAASKNQVKRFVYCSSSEVFGSAQGEEGGVLSEDSEMRPTTVYGGSKLAGELYSRAFARTHGLETVIVRPFNAYGPRSQFSGPYGEVIPRFAVMIRAGREPVIFGDGGQTRDFTYVEETAAALVAAGMKDELVGDSVNVARGEEVSVKRLAETLCRLHGRPCSPRFAGDRPGDIRRLGADVAKCRRLLGGAAPSMSLEDGVRRYLQWLDGRELDYAAVASQLTDENWK